MSALEVATVLDVRDPEVIVRVMLTFDQAADDYLGDCARRGFTPRTLQTYARTYDQFGERLPRDQDVSKVTTDDVRRYLSTKTRLAPGTIAGHESHLGSLFRQLYLEGKIGANPMDRLIRTKRRRAEDLEVTTVDPAEVRRLMAAASTWTERLACAIPAYMGPRRHAVAMLRLHDYDETRRRLRFREKGGKIIWKPVPDELAALIAAAKADGAYTSYDYIVPPEGYLSRRDGRDDRVIWRVIRRLADRAGVNCHVHALRAAFACFYEEQNPGDVLALRDLMGHASVKTTEVYLRRRDKAAGMERVRALSWGDGDNEMPGLGPKTVQTGTARTAVSKPSTVARVDGELDLIPGVAEPDNVSPVSTPQNAGITFASSPLVGEGGFEPPLADSSVPVRDGGLPELIDALDPLNHAAADSQIEAP